MNPVQKYSLRLLIPVRPVLTMARAIVAKAVALLVAVDVKLYRGTRRLDDVIAVIKEK